MPKASELINRSNTICHYKRFSEFSEPNCNGCNDGDSKMVELLHLFAENRLGRIPYVYSQPFAERVEGSFDLLQTGVVLEVEQPVHVGFWNTQLLRQGGFGDTGSLERDIQFRFQRDLRG